VTNRVFPFDKFMLKRVVSIFKSKSPKKGGLRYTPRQKCREPQIPCTTSAGAEPDLCRRRRPGDRPAFPRSSRAPYHPTRDGPPEAPRPPPLPPARRAHRVPAPRRSIGGGGAPSALPGRLFPLRRHLRAAAHGPPPRRPRRILPPIPSPPSGTNI
jgi:hypothetical protein